MTRNHAHHPDTDDDLTWRGFLGDLFVMLGIVACLYAALIFFPGVAE